MTAKKIPWQAPEIKSIDQISAVFGECRTGTSPVPGGDKQCSAGTGASGGQCNQGNGAKLVCSTGNGR